MKRLFIFVFVGILLNSCAKELTSAFDGAATIDSEDVKSSIGGSYPINDKQYYTGLMSQYAKLLSAAMLDADLRYTIKDQAMQMFDGDFDILANVLHDSGKGKSITSQMTLANKQTETGIVNVESFVKEILLRIPNLQIAVPIHCEDWDAKNYIPLVT